MQLRQVDQSYVPPRRARSLGGTALALSLAALCLVLAVGNGVPWLSSAASRWTASAPAGEARESVAVLDTIGCAARNPASAKEVAVLDFRGEIGAVFNSDAVYALLNRITMDRKIGAVALRIESTGGDSYVAKQLHEVLVKAKQTCALPMAAFIGNVGTSGGYWMALAADEIHADTLSTVGSVGVLAVFTNDSEKQASEGVHHALIRTGERKWPMNPYTPVQPGDVEKIKDSLGIVLVEFVAAVESSRHGKLKLSREQLTTGEAWMGRDAYALGLVDAPESISSTATRLLGATPSAYRFFDLAKSVETQGAGEGQGAG